MLTIQPLKDLVDNLALQQARQDRHRLEWHNRRLLQVREDERKRLARELHDDVLQDLCLLVNRLEENIRQPDLPADWHLELSQAHAQALDSIQKIRQICLNLRPRLLDVSLTFSLNDLVRRFRQEHSCPQLHFSIAGDELLSSEDARLVVYRVAQECLANILKHAHAQNVYLQLRFKPGSPAFIELVVQDDGCGFVPPANIHALFGQDHLGLIGMYERVQSQGGHIGLVSAPGNGTRVTVSVPTFLDTSNAAEKIA
jgi:signal transduction histidine kinase